MHSQYPQDRKPQDPLPPYPIIHLFPGQGDFATGPLVRALREHAVLRRSVTEVFERVDAVGARHGIAPLGPALCGPEPPSSRDLAAAPRGTLQLAAFGASVAVHRALVRVGLAPTRVFAVSFGEIAAATAAGVFGLGDGAEIAYRLAAVLPHGEAGLTLLAAGEPQARALIAALANRLLVLACVNAPDETLLCGPLGALDEVELLAAQRGLNTHRLRLPFPSHHPELAVQARTFRAALGDIRTMPPQLPVYSAVRGDVYEPDDDLRQGLADCLTRPALVPSALRRATAGEPALLLEAGTGDALARAVERCVGEYEPARAVPQETAEVCLRSVIRAPIADPAFPWREPQQLTAYAQRARSRCHR